MIKKKRSRAPTPIETQLQTILEKAESQTWTIEALFQILKGKGYPFLIVLLSLPFCQPIQIPGFSTPFGIVLIFIGLRMAFGHHIWWPRWVLEQKISPKLLKLVVQKSLGFFRFVRPLLHPRMNWLTTSFFFRIHGVFVALMGLYLALPLPIPLTNFFAAWSLFLLGLGLIEEDGLFICLGYCIGIFAVGLLGFVINWIRLWVNS